MKRLFISLLLFAFAATILAQPSVLHRQRSFAKYVPRGNFSGVAPLGQGLYSVVDDKQPDGFYVFQIDFKPKKGKLKKVTNKGFVPSGMPNRDAEDIIYRPLSNMLFINGERDSEVLEYHIDGKPTGRRLSMPDIFCHVQTNKGIEALAYDALNDCIWLTTERSLPIDTVEKGMKGATDDTLGDVLRLQSFDASTLQPLQQYAYRMESAKAKKAGRAHVMGVSALTALPDGSLLVLERECFMPKRKIGAWVQCRLFLVNPKNSEPLLSSSHAIEDEASFLEKQLLCEWRTRNLRFANYEGMCLGPVLPDGRQVLLLVCDSQNRYGSLLRDWFRTLGLPPFPIVVPAEKFAPGIEILLHHEADALCVQTAACEVAVVGLVIHLHGEVSVWQKQIAYVEVSNERCRCIGVVAITELAINQQSVVQQSTRQQALIFCVVPTFIAR